MADTRIFFDGLIAAFPHSVEVYVASNAPLVKFPNLESALVKLTSEEPLQLTESETKAMQRFMSLLDRIRPCLIRNIFETVTMQDLIT
jgi:hypothetical protein